MNKKTIGIILIVLGLIGMQISLTADMTGIGGDPDNFGWKQILGTVVGVGLIIVGIVLARMPKDSSQPKPTLKEPEENQDEMLQQ